MSYRYNLGLAFEGVVASCPDRPALILAGGHAVSFAALDRLANQLAHWLSSLGLGRRDVLALFNAKSVEGHALMLAALKIGAAYVNLDDQNPPQRLAMILATCQPRLAVSDHALPPAILDCCDAGSVPLLLLPDPAVLECLPAERLAATDLVTGTDPAYLMFTSGSTGTPKGVAIGHASVLNFIRWARVEFGIGAGDRLSGANPLHFDNSVFDFYASLFSGAALVPLGREIVSVPAELVRQVGERGCTLWFSVPSLLIYLMTMRQLSADSWPTMRCLVFGGEGYPKAELQKLFDLFHPRARLVNVYGPTECTCICSAYTLSEADFAQLHGLPPLGRLAPNFSSLVLDEEQRLVPDGEVGELCLLGPQLALGYYRNAEHSRQRFAGNPHGTGFEERFYRTGDLVRQDEHGVFWFVGRSDNQIKHLGYRIELEEIEAALESLPQIRQAVCVYHRLRQQHGRIAAFVSSRSPVDEATLRQALRDHLPAYMIPTQIEILAELPKNANGKLDRRQLQQRLAGL
ncbi:MAG TPA: amino acid adenylation domain-containing protein [Candidatus Accumulibacter phosphatis]|nr:amino acid adenylation domain-containing protein [Candidatus Accumulibacter phosphatis]HRQ94384.1 amino acid adenylation domain-containing protein [Candidatus Accumulibacter phosphatis]